MLGTLALLVALAPPQNFVGIGARATNLANTVSGTLGLAVSDGRQTFWVHGSERFSLQSVMKLMVSMAVLDKVDHGQLGLRQKVRLFRSDLSLGHQPIKEKIGPKGYRCTILELIQRAVQESDSAATDFLVRKVGGIRQVQAFLVKHKIDGMRIDRDERNLQSDTSGLKWKAAYVDEAVFDRDLKALSDAQRTAAYDSYRKDVRDTSTPQAMAKLLIKLANGQLLSKSSTKTLLTVMEGTTTYPDRLKAGIPAGWRFGHKTGSSGTWQGITPATNDVGIARNGEGKFVVLVAFLKDSTATPKDRNEALANVARIAFAETN